MRLRFLAMFIVCCTLQACEFHCSVGETEKTKNSTTSTSTTKRTITTNNEEGPKVNNGIQLASTGVRLKTAYLSKNDESVPDDNTIAFDGPVKIHFEFDSAWTNENGKVFLGASEKIVQDNGVIIIDEQDVFAKYPDGVPYEDAKYVNLTAKLTLKEGSPKVSVTVYFRIWDKKGTGSIEGSYQVHSK